MAYPRYHHAEEDVQIDWKIMLLLTTFGADY